MSVKVNESKLPLECYTLEGISTADDNERCRQMGKRHYDLEIYVKTALKRAIDFFGKAANSMQLSTKALTVICSQQKALEEIPLGPWSSLVRTLFSLKSPSQPLGNGGGPRFESGRAHQPCAQKFRQSIED